MAIWKSACGEEFCYLDERDNHEEGNEWDDDCEVCKSFHELRQQRSDDPLLKVLEELSHRIATLEQRNKRLDKASQEDEF